MTARSAHFVSNAAFDAIHTELAAGLHLFLWIAGSPSLSATGWQHPPEIPKAMAAQRDFPSEIGRAAGSQGTAEATTQALDGCSAFCYLERRLPSPAARALRGTTKTA